MPRRSTERQEPTRPAGSVPRLPHDASGDNTPLPFARDQRSPATPSRNRPSACPTGCLPPSADNSLTDDPAGAAAGAERSGPNGPASVPAGSAPAAAALAGRRVEPAGPGG